LRCNTSGQTASNLPAACGAAAVSCTRSAPRKGIHVPPQHAATAGWRKEKNPIPPIIGAADTRRRRCRKRSRRGHPGLQQEGCSLQTSPLRRVRGGSPRQDRGTAAASDTSGGSGRSRHNGTQGPCALAPTGTADNRSSVRAPNVNCPATMEPRPLRSYPNRNSRQQVSQFGNPNVNSLPLDKMLRAAVTVVQQIMQSLMVLC
jgi:hypothetical protein